MTDEAPMWDVVITGYVSKVRAIKAVSDLLGYDLLSEAKRFIEGLPATFCECEDQEAATTLAEELKWLGLEVEVRKTDKYGMFFNYDDGFQVSDGIIVLGDFADPDQESYYLPSNATTTFTFDYNANKPAPGDGDA